MRLELLRASSDSGEVAKSGGDLSTGFFFFAINAERHWDVYVVDEVLLLRAGGSSLPNRRLKPPRIDQIAQTMDDK